MRPYAVLQYGPIGHRIHIRRPELELTGRAQWQDQPPEPGPVMLGRRLGSVEYAGDVN